MQLQAHRQRPLLRWDAQEPLNKNGMKTDAQRLELVLDFVNGPDVEDANQRELRESLASFLGYPLLEDGAVVPDLTNRWPSNIGGTSFEVTAHIDVSVTSLHIDMGELSVGKVPKPMEGLSDFIGFGPEAVPVPVGVLRELQNRTRQLIHRHLGSKDSVLYVNELAEKLGGTLSVVGRGADLRTHISAEPEVAFLWIVLLLVNSQPAIRVCANSKCEKLFVGTRKTKLYCSGRCGQAVRDRRHYSKPEKRKRKVEYMRAKRASERR